MSTTYAETKAALDEIAGRINQNQARLQSAQQQIATAEAELAAMSEAYAPVVADLDAAAAANSDNTALQVAKQEKDLLVAEYQALKATAAAMKDALAALNS